MILGLRRGSVIFSLKCSDAACVVCLFVTPARPCVQAPVVFEKSDEPTEMEVNALKVARKNEKKRLKAGTMSALPKKNVRKRR
jgi:hypothetical protein